MLDVRLLIRQTFTDTIHLSRHLQVRKMYTDDNAGRWEGYAWGTMVTGSKSSSVIWGAGVGGLPRGLSVGTVAADE